MVRSLLMTLLCFTSQFVMAAGPEPILLWPDGAPGAVGEEAVDKPEIRIYLPESDANGAMVVVCPGGGYGALATDHEGHQVAKWLNSIGVSAAVVKYRLGRRYQHPAPLQDAQRAIRYVRAHADELKIDPHRVGIMGFSAGGHLASTVSTHFDAGDANSQDPVAQQSSRPDFSILCYPVISLVSDFSHKGSARNLLGENPDPEMLKSLSNETQVTDQTPPTFIFHTAADKGVPPQNALVYYRALVEHNVPAELHIYQNGTHGVGLAPGDPVLSTWSGRLADWLKVNGFLKPVTRGKVSGTIDWDGQPLRWGSIAFLPQDKNAPAAFAMVNRGKYSLSEELGPAVGVNQVQIVSLGDVVPYPTIEDAKVWTVNKGLVVDVTANENIFDFDLND